MSQRLTDRSKTVGPPSAPAVDLQMKIAVDQKRDLRPFHMKDFKQLKFVENIEKRYSLGDVLGQGAFGTVRLCRQVDTGKQLAVKIMRKQAVR